MKRWLSPWVLPLLMLGVVVVITRPLAGAIWIVASVVLVRVLNGHFEPLADDQPLRRYLDDPRHSYLGAPQEPYVRTPS
ncbi:MAG TPA: hypothetical protein VHX62_06905 [Solirubrobacteraceae bacterium]|nr:hypothetical protein [Solirubrobacteraceae bacterium]